jgi:hypothetical protein
MTGYSKPRTLGLAQDWVTKWGHLFRLDLLIRDYLAYDEENIGTDWDLADACNNAIVRINDRKNGQIKSPDEDVEDGIDLNAEISYHYDRNGTLVTVLPPERKKKKDKSEQTVEEVDYILG